jgi:hypothetical protein
MKAPWPIYAANIMVVAPLLAAVVRPSRTRGARIWVATWSALYVLENAIAIPLALNGHNNHLLTYIFVPLQGAAILWAFSLWQTQQMPRLTMRAAIPGFLLAWLLLLSIEDLSSFSAVAEPVYSLLALAAALYTLVTRGAASSLPLLRQDWFWVCGGLALHFGALALLTPLGAALVRSNPDVVVRAYTMRAWINMLAYACVTIGLLCPPPSALSGRSFSPALSA